MCVYIYIYMYFFDIRINTLYIEGKDDPRLQVEDGRYRWATD